MRYLLRLISSCMIFGHFPGLNGVIKTTLFLIKPDKLEKMKQHVISDPEAKGVIKSISDIVQAFLWRAAIRVRYRVANGGLPESLRPQLERGNGRFRFLVTFPIRKDGGIELAFGTHPEELEMFQADEEFTKYAELVDTCC